jgi:hypothetical protein
VSYTLENTKYLLGEYENEPTKETVERIGKELGKSTKSVIGKLSREGVYRRELYLSKTGDVPTTKIEIVATIAETLGIEAESLYGLEKSPKGSLRNLEKAVAGLQQVQQVEE